MAECHGQSSVFPFMAKVSLTFRPRRSAGAAALLAAVLSNPACATDVALAGVFPGKALLIVNGGAPRAVGVGTTTREGVRVLSVDGDSATVEIDGLRQRVVVGQHPVSVQGAQGRGAATVTIEADRRGMFHTDGSINGAPVHFLVDTGATLVALGRSDAQRAGLDITKGEPIRIHTANGLTQGWRLALNSVKVGGITLNNVDGVVHSSELPAVLLGASFLNRMEMRRDGTALQLRQRF